MQRDGISMNRNMSSLSPSGLSFRLVWIVCALFAFNQGAVAAEPQARGFYAGGMVGVTTFDDDGLFDGYNLDDSDVGYAVFGGYKFFRYLAVEGRLSYLGNYSVNGTYAGEKQDFDASAISAHVIGIIPFGKSGWEMFGQLGLGSVKVNADCCGDDNQTAGSAGIGVRFYPNANLGISLQTDAYAYEEDTYYKTYDVAIAATQVAVHYVF